MKNALNYYYHLEPIDIHHVNEMYKFKNNDEYYTLIETNYNQRQIEIIYKISIEMNKRGIYTHQIVLNNQNTALTFINNQNYILLKSYNEMTDPVSIQHLIYFSKQTKDISFENELRRDNWYKLWTNKIDYFEYQVNQFGKKYPLIRESFSYFVGLAETGVSMLVNEKLNYDSLVISHKRIKKNNTLFDLYNPLNFIIDIEVRDLCEYFKEKLKNDNDPFDEIKLYIEQANLTKDEIKLFYIRMYFPSFYFDLYEDIIENDKQEEELLKIINKVNDYEMLLKKTHIYLSNYVELPNVEWIKKT